MRSFDVVDNKVAEAEFFYRKLSDPKVTFEVEWYLSAFVSAARSVNFALKATIGDIDGFDDWYKPWETRLRADSDAKYFLELRNASQKVGATVVNRATLGQQRDLVALLKRQLDGEGRHWFGNCGEGLPPAPTANVNDACRKYLTTLVELVFDCYVHFGTVIDPHQYYTKETFERRGVGLEHAVAEVFGLPLSTLPSDIPHDWVWQKVRESMPGCRIDHLFDEYLGKSKPCPDYFPSPPAESVRLPPGWTRKDGWILPPGYESAKAFLNSQMSDTDRKSPQET